MRSFVAAAAMALLLIACCACSTVSAVTGRPTSAAPITTAHLDDKTLGAATVAAQDTIDHFSSGDFAGVWERMTKHVRDHITQVDFVTFYEACKKAGTSIPVTGLWLEGEDEAIVRMIVAGRERSRTMLYEDGGWFMEPTDDFENHLGEPVEQIVAEETTDGHCGR